MFSTLFAPLHRSSTALLSPDQACTDTDIPTTSMNGANATPWTVRAPYSIIDPDEENEDTKEPTMIAENGPRRKSRPARPTPAYLENFVRPGGSDSDRLFNTRSSIYFLPSDETEFERLERQHTAFTLGFGGLYPCPEAVKEVLSPEEGKEKTILDLGCGTGVWAIEMAKEFPHTSVLGVDLIPCPARDVPSNCHFEIDDITGGLNHFAGRYDLVHVRLLSFGINNYRKVMDDISHCLKPGGLAIFIDADTELLAEDKQTILPMALGANEQPSSLEEESQESEIPTREGSWFQRLLYEVRYVAGLNGSDMAEAEVVIDEGLWRMNIFDPDTCGASSLFSPVGPWPRTRDYQESQKLQYAGALIRQDCYNLIRAFQPVFLRHGISQSILDQWTTAIDYELSSQKFRSWCRLRIAWGRRKRDPSQPHSNPLSSSSSASSSMIPDIPQQSSHQMEIYHTSEQSLIAKAARKLTRSPLPVPFVTQVQNGLSISM